VRNGTKNSVNSESFKTSNNNKTSNKMKFIIAVALFTIISAVYGQKIAKPPATQDPTQPAASQMAGYINNFPGTSDALATDITNKAISEKRTYSEAQVDSFCKGVCTQLAANAKISCSAFTSIVKTNYKATN